MNLLELIYLYIFIILILFLFSGMFYCLIHDTSPKLIDRVCMSSKQYTVYIVFNYTLYIYTNTSAFFLLKQVVDSIYWLKFS